MRILLLPAIAAAGLLSAPAFGQAPPAPGGAAPSVRIEIVTDPLMMCHFHLRTAGPAPAAAKGKPAPDLGSEAGAYGRAMELTSRPEVWSWLEEIIASNPDPSTLRKAAQDPPPELGDDESRAAIGMLIDALESAFPKYEKSVYPAELEGLNRILVGARKRFLSLENRVGQALMAQMGFQPIGKPVRVYVVTRTGGVSSWGAGRDFFFTVIGAFGLAPMNLIESALHETTHIIDGLQPFNSRSVMAEVRRGLSAASRDEVEVFLHGLVAFNAGELVRRFLSQDYAHAGVRAPGEIDGYRPYLSTYEYIWTDYMDGKMTAEGVSKKLVEEFEAVRKLQSPRKEAGS